MRTLLVTIALLTLASGALAQSPVFFSEYVEGSGFNKALEIYNNTDDPLDMSRVTVELYVNGSSSPNYTYAPTGTLLSGDVWVVANSSGNTALLDAADALDNSLCNFNGDDALVMYLDGEVADSIGQVGFDPGSYWGTEPITTAEHTLVRKSENCDGDVDYTDAFDPSFIYDAYGRDDFSFIGFHVTSCQAVPEQSVSFGEIKSLFR